MRTHIVFYFKQRINKGFFQDVRRINSKAYFSMSLDHRRKSDLLPSTFYFALQHAVYSQKRRKKKRRKNSVNQNFSIPIYIFPLYYIIKTRGPKWTQVLKELKFLSFFPTSISFSFTRMAEDFSIALREGNKSLHF